MNAPERENDRQHWKISPALKELNRHGAAVRTGNTEIRVTTDDRQATSTIPATAGRMGFHTEVVRQDGSYHIRIYGGA